MTTAEPQAVLAPLTNAAIFVVVVLGDGTQDAVRDLCDDLPGLVRTVSFREPAARLSCVIGFGSRLWDTLGAGKKPSGLHTMAEIRGMHHAVSTPGDLLLHVRAERMDLCFELVSLIMARLGDAVAYADEVHGFRYFDARDLLGFVDGTENPEGALAAESVLIGAEELEFAGGSYVIVQKYLHDLAAWERLTVEEQELVIGRTKLSNVELDDDVKPANAHNALTVIERDGQELKILRDNMPFGSVSRGEFGTYFIGYSRTPDVIELMLTNMFVGDPPGNYDRILDFSTAVTGSLFFVPSTEWLKRLAQPPPPAYAGSLDVGSLKGVPSA
ncbi:Dyp-type peroxidase [Nonomuraea soli]|uniref:Putative iron-dependent peroxidase n=1 Tax=Nonomuraea soli TaxID=1032476 RepID=A0A7W0HR10_9ACTN|nr:Dyp-type peroxidase [Nonomuraea soli]MBA2892450.1 putative iron-dependent peroxidase [Nonomuraea soli]